MARRWVWADDAFAETQRAFLLSRKREVSIIGDMHELVQGALEHVDVLLHEQLPSVPERRAFFAMLLEEQLIMLKLDPAVAAALQDLKSRPTDDRPLLRKELSR